MNINTDTIKANAANMAGITASGRAQTAAALIEGSSQAAVCVGQIQAQLMEASEAAMKKAAKIVRFGQGNVEALTKSSQIWATGAQDFSKQAVASLQASFDVAADAFKTLGATTSLKQAIDLQSGFLRTSLEKMASESGQLTEASFKLSEKVAAPIAGRVKLSGDVFGKLL